MFNFADDTKLGIDDADLKSARTLKRNFAYIGELSTVWQMPFSLDKYHAMHVGIAGQAENYSLLDSEISRLNLKWDLGVIITANLKSSVQCMQEEKKSTKDAMLYKAGDSLLCNISLGDPVVDSMDQQGPQSPPQQCTTAILFTTIFQ